MATKYCDNRTIIQAKFDTVEKFQFFLSERLEGITTDNLKEEFEKLSLEFHKSIEDEYEKAEAEHKAKTISRHAQRSPSAYSSFITNTMHRLKTENPQMRTNDLMRMSVEAWNTHKTANTTAKSTNTVTPRPPTEYNIFIKSTMERIKTENPDMNNIELMTMAAQAWNERRNANTY